MQRAPGRPGGRRHVTHTQFKVRFCTARVEGFGGVGGGGGGGGLPNTSQGRNATHTHHPVCAETRAYVQGGCHSFFSSSLERKRREERGLPASFLRLICRHTSQGRYSTYKSRLQVWRPQQPPQQQQGGREEGGRRRPWSTSTSQVKHSSSGRERGVDTLSHRRIRNCPRWERTS